MIMSLFDFVSPKFKSWLSLEVLEIVKIGSENDNSDRNCPSFEINVGIRKDRVIQTFLSSNIETTRLNWQMRS